MQSGLLLEHTFRLYKQVLGWTAPKIRNPEAADRWTWLIITTHAQLRLARPLAADLRLPWERPAPPGRLTPARVRRGFRNIHATAAQPARAPKPGKPGPGRPPGSTNRRPAPRHDVGKTTKFIWMLCRHAQTSPWMTAAVHSCARRRRSDSGSSDDQLAASARTASEAI
jgi:hypothetical protein